MEENEWKQSLLKIFDAYKISFSDEIHKEMVSQEIQFLSARYRGQEDQEQDEALWTEYAKAALVGLFSNPGVGTVKTTDQDIMCFADSMLAAHKKRWGHE